jgi:hypothetical protein
MNAHANFVKSAARCKAQRRFLSSKALKNGAYFDCWLTHAAEYVIAADA